MKLIAFDSDENGFGGGKMLFMNTTEMQVGGIVGKTEFSLEPHGHEILAPEPSEEKGSRKYLFTKLYVRQDQKEEVFYSSTWRFNDKARNLVFFCLNTENQKLQLHIIRDYL